MKDVNKILVQEKLSSKLTNKFFGFFDWFQEKMDEMIKKYRLIPHPEGGHYQEIFKSLYKTNCIDGKERYLSTSIIYMLKKGEFSNFHKILGDELWYFHDGCDMEIHILDPNDKSYTVHFCGKEKGSYFQVLVKGGCWFAARPKLDSNASNFSVVGCMVSPGFDFQDFEMADRQELLKLFPNEKKIILEFTRNE